MAALAASLCCIAPLLAIFEGISGAATFFNWIEPFQPYIIGITILIFAIAWYEKFVMTTRQQDDCCEPSKRSFWQSKKFLLIVTLFCGALIAFPYYSSLFYKAPQQASANGNVMLTLSPICFAASDINIDKCFSRLGN